MSFTPQAGLFSAENLAASVCLASAPKVEPHSWPFPGLSGLDSARSALADSESYADLLAAVIKSEGGQELTSGQVLAKVPQDWREALGKWAHGVLSQRQAEQRNIKFKFVSHEGGGHHYTYTALEAL